MKECRGFTLIELMIVVAVIGILAAVAMPMLTEYRNKAFNAAALSDVRNLLSFETGFVIEYGEFAPITASDNVNGSISATITLQGYSGTALFEMNAVSQNNILICKTSADNIYGIAAGKHQGGTMIIANDMDQPGLMKKNHLGDYDETDLPDSTADNDLSSWVAY